MYINWTANTSSSVHYCFINVAKESRAQQIVDITLNITYKSNIFEDNNKKTQKTFVALFKYFCNKTITG